MQRKSRTITAMVTAISAALLLVGLNLGGSAGCGGSGGGGTGSGTGSIAAVTVNSISSTGDFTPGLSFYAAEGGGLGIRANALDVNGDGTASTPTITSVRVSSVTAALATGALAADETLKCTDAASSGAATDVGVGLSLDTTASMGSTVAPIATGIAQLATDLDTAGFTGLFAGVTLGDAYATKAASGSAYDAAAQGTKGAPPPFDTVERPNTGTEPVGASVVSAFFNQVATVVGSGDDGGDGTENYLGPLEFLNTAVGFASGTQRVLISVGDNCSHTEESFATFADSSAWTPPAKASVADTFAGTIVHVIGPAEPFCADDEYDMSLLAAATGGIFKNIQECDSADEVTPCVNSFLASINSAIAGGAAVECDVTADADSRLVLLLTIEDEGRTAESTADLSITTE